MHAILVLILAHATPSEPIDNVRGLAADLQRTCVEYKAAKAAGDADGMWTSEELADDWLGADHIDLRFEDICK